MGNVNLSDKYVKASLIERALDDFSQRKADNLSTYNYAILILKEILRNAEPIESFIKDYADIKITSYNEAQDLLDHIELRCYGETNKELIDRAQERFAELYPDRKIKSIEIL